MTDSDLALALLAVAPQALGGARLRGPAGHDRDAWLQGLRSTLPASMPWRRLPLHASDDALLGSLDLAATLAAGRPLRQAGLLDGCRGGVLLAAMAERMKPGTAAQLARPIDDAELAVLALDEGLEPDEAPPQALLERLALEIEPQAPQSQPSPDAVAAARAHWRAVTVDDALLCALVAGAEALGVPSLRASIHALCALRVHAALAGRSEASADDAVAATRLVLAPRATRWPTLEDDANADQDAEPAAAPAAAGDEGDDRERANVEDDRPLEDRILEAARAAIPPGLLALLSSGRSRTSARGEAGRSGQALRSQQRGRPIGSVRGLPRGAARLALIDTLRAAAPWQPLRRRMRPGATQRVLVSRDDLHIQRRVQRRATTTVFAIDASGSQALHRLAEAKGAVELLLADCYARRDRVAVIGFRGTGAQLLLAPTRSLVHARRQLAGLPGGGGTPLAGGIDAAHQVCDAVRRSGGTALLVLLTDGRANIGRDGTPGRESAMRDALGAARQFAHTGTRALLIDTSTQTSAAARELAAALGAVCVALPHADAQVLSLAVRAERGSVGPRSRSG